ncbi:MAG: 3-methyladenine DNA glycosylase [Candidatus Methanofastidiosa archaeon]|nr:3-methyladenine DNA glycosylase [Candidatus Methanofastidiosa archaeon]
MPDYKSIFSKAEETLRSLSWFSPEEFDKTYGRFKKFETRKRTDAECFEILTMIIFYSGFRASTVESKEKIILNHFPDYESVSIYGEEDVKRILSDQSMIRNERKIRSVISNARMFRKIVVNHGSFMNYLESFNASNSDENLLLLKKELEYRFEYIGGITVYHLLTDLGFNVLKPDRVLVRIFKRLGIIENEKRLFDVVIQGRQFAKHTGLPIRYIDIIFVKLGQQGASEMFGLQGGICLDKTPDCKSCGLKDFCIYYKSQGHQTFNLT